MNKGRYISNARAGKKVKRAVRKGLQELDTPKLVLKSNQLKAVNLQRKRPVAARLKDKTSLATLHHQMTLKRGKAHGKPSKRTTPGTVAGRNSSSKNSHVEGRRWLQNLVKQTLVKGKRVARRLAHSFR